MERLRAYLTGIDMVWIFQDYVQPVQPDRPPTALPFQQKPPHSCLQTVRESD